ncbi:Methyltransferase FkbM family [uncultured Mycobacterium sp.]|uniref:Methyltransferase FkbM family n=1 Tax=uncultured Mycobacterium sp. TaxID=171292 RepID=A0A1Y5NZN6_9MYCO|nr:Methyltransferase FkbM family [uncultured Mycobacterium sp.]
MRSTIRSLITSQSAVSTAEKIIRATLLTPVYLALIALLRIYAWAAGPIVVSGKTSFGATLRCRLPDLIQTYIWLFAEWEPDLTNFIATRLTDGDTFIDIGSNIGYYSLLAATCVGPNGRVIAVEASPYIANEIRYNVTANGAEGRIRVVNKAAASTAGTLTVYAGPAHNLGNTTTAAAGTRDLRAESTVEACPIDQIVTPQEIASVRLIKIDVEGGEADVLAGMIGLIPALRADAEIAVELSPQWWSDPTLRPADVLHPFTDAGFNVYQMANNYAAWRYLWPNAVTAATRVRDELTQRVARLDLILSRQDADFISIDGNRFTDSGRWI